jgi:hypothetical protein
MADHAKLFFQQFEDADGVPYGLCKAEFWNEAGDTRLRVWLDRDKTLPSPAGTTQDISADLLGRITAYGDGVYRVVIKTAGGTGITVLEGVQLVDSAPSYTGPTPGFTLEEFEERVLSGQGRQAAASGALSGSTLTLAGYAAAGRTYLVPGAAGSTVDVQYITTEDYENGARITLECVTNPFVLRARRAGEDGAQYNVSIGTDVYMTVGSSIDLELRGGQWFGRGRHQQEAHYADFEDAGVASAAALVVASRSVLVTGTTDIENVWWVRSGDLPPPGARLTLVFDDALTVENGTGNLDLEEDFDTTAGAVLDVVCTGTGWVERARRPRVDAITLGSGGTPSVAGARSVVTTGNGIDTVTRLLSPALGKVITIVFDNSLTPNDDYLNVRKKFEHAASSSEGYLSLHRNADFYGVPGDTLTLACVLNGSSVLYWKEVARTTVPVWPRLPAITGTSEGSPGTIAVWRDRHETNNGSQQYISKTSTWLGDGFTVSLRLAAGSSALTIRNNDSGTDLGMSIIGPNNLSADSEFAIMLGMTEADGTRRWSFMAEGTNA